MSVCFASSLVRRLGIWRAVGLSWGQGGGGGRMASVCAPEQCLRQRARLDLWGALLDDGTCVTLAAFENRAASPTPDLTSRTAPRRPHVTGRRAHRRARHRAPPAAAEARHQDPSVDVDRRSDRSPWSKLRYSEPICNRFEKFWHVFRTRRPDRQPEKPGEFRAAPYPRCTISAAAADGEREGGR